MDQLAATHSAQMKGLIAQASVIAAKARQNSWLAAKAAADAHKSATDAQKAATQAANSAKQAQGYAHDADVAATSAENSSTQAAKSAITARNAAESASRDADDAIDTTPPDPTLTAVTWELLGLNDLKDCIRQPTLGPCMSFAITVLPVGKLKALKRPLSGGARSPDPP
ncbi:hypothetical protein [Streptomyces silvisoli]|uniref:Uncharacterized protein n=1 Tax=Streptomyces silvisoli TaxID=3034235 RepID=A0ABT5ZHM1_9ACTN|nr:hypothetical protein [Streptomyces silvisoli]MDF3289307.1 hypothetical protein [Streptomyces silvisoli]